MHRGIRCTTAVTVTGPLRSFTVNRPPRGLWWAFAPAAPAGSATAGTGSLIGPRPSLQVPIKKGHASTLSGVRPVRGRHKSPAGRRLPGDRVEPPPFPPRRTRAPPRPRAAPGSRLGRQLNPTRQKSRALPPGWPGSHPIPRPPTGKTEPAQQIHSRKTAAVVAGPPARPESSRRYTGDPDRQLPPCASTRPGTALETDHRSPQANPQARHHPGRAKNRVGHLPHSSFPASMTSGPVATPHHDPSRQLGEDAQVCQSNGSVLRPRDVLDVMARCTAQLEAALRARRQTPASSTNPGRSIAARVDPPPRTFRQPAGHFPTGCRQPAGRGAEPRLVPCARPPRACPGLAYAHRLPYLVPVAHPGQRPWSWNLFHVLLLLDGFPITTHRGGPGD